MSKKYDLVVLGSGPGGYVTAIRASQLGLKTAIIEKESLGGVCLNWGCIPTKALLKSAQVFEYLKKAETYGLKIKDFDKDFDSVVKRSRSVADGMSKGVNFLMKKNKIDYFVGEGHIDRSGHITVNTVKKNLKKKSIKTSNILIATGSYAAALPNIIIDQKQVLDSTGALSLKKVPKTLAVIGAGVIGLELGSVWRRLGAKVTGIDASTKNIKIAQSHSSKNKLNIVLP